MSDILTVDAAIEAFAHAADAPPNDALRWALSNWDQAAPRLLALLEAYADGADDSDITTDAMFFIVHLCGDRGEQRAYPALCRMMLDEDRLNAALGEEASVDTLKGVLIKCFNGDVRPLQQVIEAIESDSITRGEALLALAWIARSGRWPETEMRAYLRHLLNDMKPREADFVWYNLVVVAACLGYDEFVADSSRLLEDGWVPEEWMTPEEYPDLRAQGDKTGTKGLEKEDVKPFDDVIGALADWPWDDDFDDGDMGGSTTPYINPLRYVGRNDPCPCGSGKKFKNCCLVAE